jgi:hypothetical protein
MISFASESAVHSVYVCHVSVGELCGARQRRRAVQVRRRVRGEEAVHDVVRVRREADEEEQLRAALDRAHDALEVHPLREPARDQVPEDVAREEEDRERAGERGGVRDEEARHGAERVACGSVGVSGGADRTAGLGLPESTIRVE